MFVAWRFTRKHHELVAPETRDRVGIAERAAQHARRRAQQVVTGGMPVLIVRGLETIEIDIQEQSADRLPVYGVELCCGDREQATAIEKSCQLVPDGRLLELERSAFSLRRGDLDLVRRSSALVTDKISASVITTAQRSISFIASSGDDSIASMRDRTGTSRAR